MSLLLKQFMLKTMKLIQVSSKVISIGVRNCKTKVSHRKIAF